MKCNLELVKTDKGCYWYMEYKHKHERNNIYLKSVLYDSDEKAISAIVYDKIQWEVYTLK